MPEGERIYVIGDIHGRSDLLAEKIDLIDKDFSQRGNGPPTIVFLGDYIDRGKHSVAVLDLLIALEKTHRVIALTGNHEDVLLNVLDDPGLLDWWLSIGGISTLQAFGVQYRSERADDDVVRELTETLSNDHMRFLRSLVTHHEIGDFFFVHAGIRPGIDLVDQNKEDLLWIRDEFLSNALQHPKFIVHGHTPVLQPDLKHNRLNIDTGAFVTGRLTCLVLDGDRKYFI